MLIPPSFLLTSPYALLPSSASFRYWRALGRPFLLSPHQVPLMPLLPSFHPPTGPPPNRASSLHKSSHCLYSQALVPHLFPFPQQHWLVWATGSAATVDLRNATTGYHLHTFPHPCVKLELWVIKHFRRGAFWNHQEGSMQTLFFVALF